jgi:flagellar biosynthetic protein FliR
MDLLLASAYGFALVLFRAAALCAVAPVLGSASVPPRIRIGLSLVLAFAAWSGAGSPALALPGDLLTLVSAAAVETIIGLAGGFAARAALEAAAAAGHLAGLGMGIGYGALLDPVSGVEAPVLANLFSTAALGGAVALGLHRELVLWLCRSLQAVPAGGALELRALLLRSITSTLEGAALGLRLGLPFLGAVALGHLALGVLSRATPQLSLQSLGFTVAIGVGGWALWLLAPQATSLAASAAVAALAR